MTRIHQNTRDGQAQQQRQRLIAKERHPDHGQVWNYFHRASTGFFLDVGANHPVTGNQTWLLEQQGWTGILVEPHPEMAALLRQERPRSRLVEAAAGAPTQAGEVELHLGSQASKSIINPEYDECLSGRTVRVPLRTLDSILEEAGSPRLDFVSIDVEGQELNVLSGFDLQRWRPRLIVIEDFFYNRQRHAYLKQQAYKLVKRIGYNNWYVPADAPASFFSLNSPREMFFLMRKMWLSGPFIGVRRKWRKTRFVPRGPEHTGA